jgi:DnaJ-class molecular chaperone
MLLDSIQNCYSGVRIDMPKEFNKLITTYDYLQLVENMLTTRGFTKKKRIGLHYMNCDYCLGMGVNGVEGVVYFYPDTPPICSRCHGSGKIGQHASIHKIYVLGADYITIYK